MKCVPVLFKIRQASFCLCVGKVVEVNQRLKGRKGYPVVFLHTSPGTGPSDVNYDTAISVNVVFIF